MSDRAEAERVARELCATLGCGYCSRPDAAEVNHPCEDYDRILAYGKAQRQAERERVVDECWAAVKAEENRDVLRVQFYMIRTTEQSEGGE